MKKIRYASVAALLALGLAAGSAGSAGAAPAGSERPGLRAGERALPGEVSAQRTFTTWATKVNVRHNNADWGACNTSPSVANCPDVQGRVNPGDYFEAWCQKEGSQTVGGNPYWVYVIMPSFEGWMASYYVDHPDNVLPDVAWCG
ncbi:hypothetical protein [Streptomyces aidingensis]|uniref:SH3 domain-containing protein n=1 Tax=Streptomyces aidingensis TaxID=910347 RepID=A0A1I1J088_9ACTN|nr:hypothetical protein [Streptomyces aidingensis]SFC41924.1 hypothetical protein SAMN05421773_103240 [Streptomyces aidingensis]